MPTYIDIEPAFLKWQAKYQQRLTYEELAKKAGISIAALYRIKSGEMIAPDLRKINKLCKVLECEPGDLIQRDQTGDFDPVDVDKVQREEILRKERKRAERRNNKAHSG